MNPDYFKAKTKRWDDYFLSICNAVATKSPCLSRQIGCLLVRDHSIISTGYNGPPRGVPHCGAERFEKDMSISFINKLKEFEDLYTPSDIRTTCPRRLLGYKSGEGVEWCPAQHAEENAISNAARIGAVVNGSTLYMNSVIPCNKCLGTLINAGIIEIVITSLTLYDDHTQFLFDNANIKLREFTK